MYALLLLALVTTAVCGQNTYVIVAPSKLRENMKFSVSVNILKSSGPVVVEASILRDTTTVAKASNTFQAGNPGDLQLQIPSALPNAVYTLTVVGSGGLTFANSTTLPLNTKKMSVFIQTDKAIYKPGDDVHIRAFGAYPDLSVFTGVLNISIYDAKGNKIKQWLQEKTIEGVVTSLFTLSSQPVLGDWKIQVEASDTKAEKVFSVKKYVLPNFDVTVITPPYVLTTESEVTFIIRSKYTYDKPVKGTAIVNVKFLHSYNSNNPSSAVTVTTVQVQIDGEGKVNVRLSDIKKVAGSLDGHLLIVTANVSESLTGNIMSGEGQVKMYDRGVVLEFLKSNPTTFKPGLESTYYLKISQPDNLPPQPSNQKVKVNINIEFESPTIVRPQISRFPQSLPSTRQLPEVEYDVPTNGLISIPFNAPASAVRVTIRAEYQGVSASLTLEKSHSPTGSYLQLFLVTNSVIQAGDPVTFRVKGTQPVQILVYQVISRGGFVVVGSINGNNQLEFTFSITTDSRMAPKARIVVYFVRPNGEVVVDTISFDVNGVFKNKVSISISKTEAEPAEEVEVRVQADPSSIAHVFAIDQRVLLLATGNDITVGDVNQELEGYDTISSNERPGIWPIDDCINCDRVKRSVFLPWPVYYGGVDAKEIFKRAGVVVLTNAFVYEKPKPIRRRIWPWPRVLFRASARSALAVNMLPMIKEQTMDSIDKGSDLQEPTIRFNFVETWIWTNMTIGDNGTASMIARVPDSITTYVASCFAVNHDTGLGIAPTQATIRVFRPFFINLNIPYSVTRGEQVVIQVNVFNYMKEDMQVRVTLARSESFFNIIIDAKGSEQLIQEDAVRNVWVKAGGASSVFLPIVPKVIGNIYLEVKAQAPMAADAVKKQLLVEPEGVPKEYNVPLLIDLTEGKSSFNQAINLSLPENTVKGSERCKIVVIGDIMGNTISGLDNLIQMPVGCGEQTMLGLAPDIAICDYLTSVNQLSPEIKTKVLSYMEIGYQRELTYKHKDGSFSAFGDTDPSGSMWLTSFVARMFIKAQSYIFIDEKVIFIALKWIISKQNSDGSFPEPGNVIHKNMQGGSGEGLGLTMYVLATLLEGKKFLSAVDSSGQQAIAKALAYAESKVDTVDDTYILALACYAFQLANSPKTKPVLDRLEAKAIVKDGMTYWKQDQTTTTSTSSWTNPNPTQAIDTETTSYVLMVYAAQNNIPKAKSVAQWIVSQRNSHGGFKSTQDTVVALFALSEFAKLIFSPTFSIHVTVTVSTTEIYTFSIDRSNALVLQAQELKTCPVKVIVSANGSGIALFDAAVFFHVQSEIEKVTFELTVKIIQETINFLVLETCTKWRGKGDSSGMAVEEIGVPSGFEADLSSISQLPSLKLVETQNKKVILYFHQISTVEVCVQLRVVRIGLVAKSQPVAVRVYDYYSPEYQVTKFYESKILKDASFCDICKDCDNCVSQRKT